MAGFIYKLQNIISSSVSDKNLDVEISLALLHNINDVSEDISISELAKLCYTSPSSLSRFALKIGYKNFGDMRDDYIGIRHEYEDLKIDNSHLKERAFSSYIDEINNGLIAMKDDAFIKKVDNLCALIAKHENVYFFATHIPGDLISIVQRAILATGKFVDFRPDRHKQIELANRVRKGDLCVVISMEGTLVMDKELSIPLFSSEATKLIVTQNMNMKFISQFDHVLSLGEPDIEFVAKYKLLVFVDVFISRYFLYHETYVVPNSEKT